MLGLSGIYPPAGVETAKSGANPVLSRNCDAPPGDEPGRPLCAERTPALGGRAVRPAAAAEPLPPQTRRFFISGPTLQSHPTSRGHETNVLPPTRRPPPMPFAPSWMSGQG